MNDWQDIGHAPGGLTVTLPASGVFKQAHDLAGAFCFEAGWGFVYDAAMPLADFPAQRSSIELLQRSLSRGRLGHAYLFNGDDLDELEGIALALSQTLNCDAPSETTDEGIALDACGGCAPCRRASGGNHPDLHWLRPESKLRVITIDQVRSLMHGIQMKPNDARYKVGIISGVDRMNVQAANAFLKTLEEPPARSVLMLLTTEPGRILETILSRCLRLNLAGKSERRVAPEDEIWLGEFGERALQKRDGLLGRYLLLGSLLERLAAIRSEVQAMVTEKSALRQHDDIDAKLRDKWESELNAGIESEYRRRRAELLTTLEWWLRDVWLKSRGVADDMLAFAGFADTTTAVAAGVDPADALGNLASIEETTRLLNTNAQEALTLEVCLLKLKL